jgi:hypothetical protein
MIWIARKEKQELEQKNILSSTDGKFNNKKNQGKPGFFYSQRLIKLQHYPRIRMLWVCPITQQLPSVRYHQHDTHTSKHEHSHLDAQEIVVQESQIIYRRHYLNEEYQKHVA